MRPSQAPFLVGIAGPSGSGKTSLSRMLAERVPGGAVIVGLDAYYRDQSGVPEDVIDVDAPGALDHALLSDQLGALARGEPVRQPVYDYATHARTGDTRVVEPAPFVIVEGLFVLYWPEVRDALRASVFLALDHTTCLARRVARDVRERGRSREAVELHYERSVRPGYERFVHPTQSHARLVLDASQPLEALARHVLAMLASG